MKRIISTLLVMLFLILAGGCSSKTEKENSSDFSYSSMRTGYDAQPYFSANLQDIMKTENGYYYFEQKETEYLMFFDIESGYAVPVCNKAECSHDSDSDCDAAFGKDGIRITYLWYYGDSLYSCATKNSKDGGDAEVFLYKISMDGSKREKVCSLFSASNFEFVMSCHRGYVYTALNETDNKVSLYRIKLEKNAEPELIYSFDGIYPSLANFFPYKSGVAFLKMSFTDESLEEIDSQILYYDNENKGVAEIMAGAYIDDFCIYDDIIYFTQFDKLSSYDIKTKEIKEIYSFDNPIYLSFDGKYLYADVCAGFIENYDYGKHYIYVLDIEGNIIDTLTVSSSCLCDFGDENYLFQVFDWDADLSDWKSEPVMKFLDKSQIGTGLHEWKEIR